LHFYNPLKNKTVRDNLQEKHKNIITDLDIPLNKASITKIQNVYEEYNNFNKGNKVFQTDWNIKVLKTFSF
jgi:hypothetical protein